MRIRSLTPRYGDNYKLGYIGFTFNAASPVSRGIAYLTAWARMSEVAVSHALVVTGERRGVEAAIGKGVVERDLADYFENPAVHIVFRKPRRYTPAVGARIAKTARGQVGAGYDHLLVAAHALHGCFLGRWTRAVFGSAPETAVSRILNAPDRWSCSELVAYALDSQPEYADRGVLRKPDFTINPQELFEDAALFCAWRGRLTRRCRANYHARRVMAKNGA